MALREDLDRALAALGGKSNARLALDDSGRCTIPIPMPPSVVKLAEGRLFIRIELSRTGRFFTLSSPVGGINGQPSVAFLEALFHRQFYADQVAGASFAIQPVGEETQSDLLVVLYHWMVGSITPEQFADLFKQFVSAVLTLVEEINYMATREPSLTPIHGGQG